jgi:hypothetical protein
MAKHPTITLKQRQDYARILQKDHPAVEREFIELLLDCYMQDPGWIEKMAREKQKVQKLEREPGCYEAKGIEITREPAPEIDPKFARIIFPKTNSFSTEPTACSLLQI